MIGRMVLGAAVLAAAMVAAPAAWAGGYSTVGLQSLPHGVEPGEAWGARFTVLAHGRTPASGLEPVVAIERADGERRHTFAATETADPGTYRARVRFPAAGRWTIEVAEYRNIPGHSFGAVQVGDAAASTSGGGTILTALGAALAAGLLAGGAAWLAQRQRRPARQSPPAPRGST